VSEKHKTVSGQINNDDAERFEEFREDRDLNKSQAVRRLIDRGLEYHEDWAVVRDIGLAAVLWAAAAAVSSVVVGTPPRALSMFSVVFAGVILTAWAIYKLRWRRRDA